ncbi:MAG: hypothetical protein R3244_09085 [Thermoanaerobaculia bacterium]|nr:hypothetical protein [Thermoanaerobaculia bacterium]
MPLPPLFSALPSDFASRFDPTRPWELLGEPLDEVLGELPGERIEVRLSPEVHLSGERIVVGPGCRIAPGATLEGPLRLGRDVVVRPGAFVRGGVWVGDGCLIGANTEIKRAILLPGARAPHLAYVGDSLLGSGVNLGAGTVLSNFRHDGGEIALEFDGVRFSTERSKLGDILGDEVKTVCNTVLNPGVVVGRRTLLYPGVVLRSGVYPADSIVKLTQQTTRVDRRPD